jgi:hypothetical protein
VEEQNSVQIYFLSKMEILFTGTWRFEITWIKICLDVELAAQQTKTWHRQVGHQEVRIERLVISSCGDISKAGICSPLPVSVNDLKQPITTAVASVEGECSAVFGTNWIVV